MKKIMLISTIFMGIYATPDNIYLENKRSDSIGWQAYPSELRTIQPAKYSLIWTNAQQKLTNFRIKIGPALIDKQALFDTAYAQNSPNATIVVSKEGWEISSEKPSTFVEAPARPTEPAQAYNLAIINKYKTPIILTVNGQNPQEIAPEHGKIIGKLANITSLSISSNKKDAIKKDLKEYLSDINNLANTRTRTKSMTEKSGTYVLNIEPTNNIFTWKIGTQFFPQ